MHRLPPWTHRPPDETHRSYKRATFLFRAAGAHTHAGDSGGPCFRETPEGRWLVGINSGHANSGTASWFTSTFHFRAWIAEQMRKVDTD
jgi:secreted trypsin-like serine protease